MKVYRKAKSYPLKRSPDCSLLRKSAECRPQLLIATDWCSRDSPRVYHWGRRRACMRTVGSLVWATMPQTRVTGHGVQPRTFCDAFGLLGRTDWRGDRLSCEIGESWPLPSAWDPKSPLSVGRFPIHFFTIRLQCLKAPTRARPSWRGKLLQKTDRREWYGSFFGDYPLVVVL